MKWYLLIVFATALTACCSEDKICPDATVSDFNTLPYQQFNNLQFRDSMGRTIGVMFNNPIILSKGNTYKGSCAFMKGDNLCIKSLSLKNSSIVDSNNLLNYNLKNFTISATINERKIQSIFLNAFGNYGEYATESNGNTLESIYNFNKQNLFLSPYKTYSNVFMSKFNNYKSKLIIDNKGRLVSFGLPSDTLNLFYLVE